MSQAETLALVQTLSNGQADAALCANFYADVVSTLGDWHTTAVPISVTANSALITFDAGLLDLIQLIYDNEVISRLGLRELEGIRFGWRNSPGRPIAYTLEAETTKTAELFPVPQWPSPVPGPPPISPSQFSPGNVIAIYGQQVTDCLEYLNLPVALKVLQREFSRESNHQSMDFANAAGMIADMLLQQLKADGILRST